MKKRFLLPASLCACLATCASSFAQGMPAPSSPVDGELRVNSAAPLPVKEVSDRQYVKLMDGSFSGHASAFVSNAVMDISNAKVVLSDGGLIVAESQTGASGEFTFAGVQPGDYTLVMETQNSLAIVGLRAFDASVAGGLANHLEVSAASPRGARMGELVSMASTPVAAAMEAGATQTEDQLFELRSIPHSSSVSLNSQGELVGRISRNYSSDRSMSDMVVYVLEENRQLASVMAGVDGLFRVPGLKVGSYSLVAVGQADIAVMGFEVVGETLAQVGQGDQRFVATVQPPVELAVPSAPIASLPPTTTFPAEEYYIVEEEPVAFMGGGGSYGGYGPIGGGGGGGGFLGGNAIGGLVGAAGLAGVIYAISEADDDDFNFNPPPVVTQQN